MPLKFSTALSEILGKHAQLKYGALARVRLGSLKVVLHMEGILKLADPCKFPVAKSFTETFMRPLHAAPKPFEVDE